MVTGVQTCAFRSGGVEDEIEDFLGGVGGGFVDGVPVAGCEGVEVGGFLGVEWGGLVI